jgi:hypothetical protein
LTTHFIVLSKRDKLLEIEKKRVALKKKTEAMKNVIITGVSGGIGKETI